MTVIVRTNRIIAIHLRRRTSCHPVSPRLITRRTETTGIIRCLIINTHLTNRWESLPMTVIPRHRIFIIKCWWAGRKNAAIDINPWNNPLAWRVKQTRLSTRYLRPMAVLNDLINNISENSEWNLVLTNDLLTPSIIPSLRSPDDILRYVKFYEEINNSRWMKLEFTTFLHLFLTWFTNLYASEALHVSFPFYLTVLFYMALRESEINRFR